MALDRLLPDGTEDYTGAEYMDELQAEGEGLWKYTAVPLTNVAGTNTITADSIVPSADAPHDGESVILKPLNSTTGPATLNRDSTGARDILDYAGTPIGENGLLEDCAYLLTYFSAVPTGWRVITGPGGFGNVQSAAVICANQPSDGTAGGGATSGSYLTYPLTTAVLNELSGEGAALASNDVTLPAGTYDVLAVVPFHLTGNSRIRLFNVTDSAVVAGVASASVRATTANEIKSAVLSGRFTLASQKTLRLQYRVATTRATDGLGTASSFTEVEQYGVIRFLRPAEGGLDGVDGATVEEVLDELGIHAITISTDAPSGGQDGDLWFTVLP